MKNEKINTFREVMKRGMIENFQSSGHLTPVLFFLKGDKPLIGEIPYELLGSNEGKEILANLIRNKCQEPDVLAAGMIIEAYGTKLKENDNDLKKIIAGEMRVSDCVNKQDLIVMAFSTPEKEEVIIYEVDCENKTIGDLYDDKETKSIMGRFSNLFTWNKN